MAQRRVGAELPAWNREPVPGERGLEPPGRAGMLSTLGKGSCPRPQHQPQRCGCSPQEAAGFTRPCAATVPLRYFNSASEILPLIEQNIIELEMSLNYFLKNRL